MTIFLAVPGHAPAPTGRGPSGEGDAEALSDNKSLPFGETSWSMARSEELAYGLYSGDERRKPAATRARENGNLLPDSA